MRISTLLVALVASVVALPSPDANAEAEAIAGSADGPIDDPVVFEDKARNPGWTKALAAQRCKYGDCNHDCSILVRSCFNMSNSTSSGLRGPPVMLRRACRNSYRACEQSCYETCFKIEQNWQNNGNSTSGSCSRKPGGGKPKGGNQ